MKNNALFELLGAVDDDLILAAHFAERKEMKQMKHKKTWKIVLIAAALLLALSVSAGAAYTFFLPQRLKEDINIDSVNLTRVIDTSSDEAGAVTVPHKTVQSAGFTVTFEAIAKGSVLRYEMVQNLNSANPMPVSYDKTYAIFTLTRDTGGPVIYDEAETMNAATIGYGLQLRNYMPNPSSFPLEPYIYEDPETNTLYFACDVTAALPLADKELSIAVIGHFVPTLEYLDMDENGYLCKAEKWDGLCAIFPLPLDPATADAEAAAALLNNGTFHSREELESMLAQDAAEQEAYENEHPIPPEAQAEMDEIYAELELLSARREKLISETDWDNDPAAAEAANAELKDLNDRFAVLWHRIDVLRGEAGE